MNLLKSALLSLGSLGACVMVQGATTVDFDTFTLATHDGSFTEGGWTFMVETSGSEQGKLTVEAAGLQSDDDNDRVLSLGIPFVVGSPVSLVSIKKEDSGTFNLEEISLGDGFGNAALKIEGYRNGVSAGYIPVEVDILESVKQVDFTGWNEIDEIRITNSTGEADMSFDIDDLVVSDVIPEPSTALLSLSLLPLFLCRRTR